MSFSDAVPIGGYDWTFTKTVPCVFNSSLFNFTKRERYQTLISCSNYTISVKKSLVNEKSVDQIFAFPNVCLGKVISSFCGDGKPVPNVIHYIWFGNMTFEFIYFVSIYSAHKHQKPCLIFLYYELLPSGTWWNLLRKIVDNIVLVKMRPPMMISGKMIKFVQHKSDIVRLKILKGTKLILCCLKKVKNYYTKVKNLSLHRTKIYSMCFSSEPFVIKLSFNSFVKLLLLSSFP